jgi:solute:Na+ symporter, SSS family
MINLHFIDLFIILLYIGFVIFLGLRMRHCQSTGVEDFLLAGRRLTLPSFVATLVSTWYGGILGVGEYSYQYGISNWLVFGAPYYLAAFIFAMFLAKRARRSETYTIPHQLEKSYGKTASLIGAFLVFVMTAPAAYVLMLATLMQFVFGWPLLWGLIAGTLFSVGYVWFGGFRSVVRTDVLQFALMFGAFALILPLSVAKFGGLDFLQQSLPKSHLVWHGGQGAQYIIVWYFIALTTLVDASFYQRCFAAKNEKVAKNGTLISILFWIVFDFMTTFTGLYARAALPKLQNPVTSYLELSAVVLPVGLQGLFLVGLLATIMSTIDSYSFVSAMTIGRDIIWRLRGEASEKYIARYTRIGLLLTAVVSIAIAWWAQSVITIWKEVGSIAAPMLLIPLASSFSNRWRLSPKAAIVSMISGGGLSGFWALTKHFEIFSGQGSYWLNVEPIFPGLTMTLLIWLIDKSMIKKNLQSEK